MAGMISRVVRKIKELLLLPRHFQDANDDFKVQIQKVHDDLKAHTQEVHDGLMTQIRIMKDSIKIANEDMRILMGVIQAESTIKKKNYKSLADLEFKVFSQFGDDGIIQYLAHNLDLRYQTFIEFGVEDYFESNTRFLLQKDNWSGYVMDGSSENMARLRQDSLYWKHDLSAHAAFVTKENINQLISTGIADWDGVDILSIDIDGNDYWVWKEIEINPAIVIMEYNSYFGIDRAITIPYDPAFYRTKAHFSNLYWGSSLKALYLLAMKKGYEFIGCASAGHNAYFVRKDKMNECVRSVSLESGYVQSKYRDSRDKDGNLTFASAKERAEILKGLPVYDVELGLVVSF
jgi:hypothetical protein